MLTTKYLINYNLTSLLTVQNIKTNWRKYQYIFQKPFCDKKYYVYFEENITNEIWFSIALCLLAANFIYFVCITGKQNLQFMKQWAHLRSEARYFYSYYEAFSCPVTYSGI